MGGESQSAAAPRRQPRLLFLARRFYGGARAALETITSEHGLTPGDYNLLYMIARRGPCSSADIARAAHITPQAATQQVAQLAAKQMIERRENPANRRIMLIEVAPLGQAALADIDGRAGQLEEGLETGFTADELAIIRRFLSRDPTAIADQN